MGGILRMLKQVGGFAPTMTKRQVMFAQPGLQVSFAHRVEDVPDKRAEGRTGHQHLLSGKIMLISRIWYDAYVCNTVYIAIWYRVYKLLEHDGQ